MFKYGVLGGGIAGLSLASFLGRPTIVLEKEATVGGLSRSYDLNGVAYDIGPHIIFSKNQEVLDLHTSMVPTNRIRRSNQIFFKGRYVKYPFENDLSALDDADRDYCLNEFLDNPYEGFAPSDMQQFFLNRFGEGITSLYLRPYNEKIWKFDPSCMDLQMVERIPKPPREDVIASARGAPTEGYTHQLHFHYPSAGGFQTLVDAYRARVEARGHEVRTGAAPRRLERLENGWRIHLDGDAVEVEQLINCAPIFGMYDLLSPPDDVREALGGLLYNSIYIVMVQVRADAIGDHFALYIPEKDILFHRLSKLNFLGEAYGGEDGRTTLMAEVTFRPGGHLSTLDPKKIQERVVADLAKLGFIDPVDVLDVELRREEYAYVIYDLHHRTRTDLLLGWLREQGVRSAGRFAEFEYLNTDGVVERTLALARELNAEPA